MLTNIKDSWLMIFSVGVWRIKVLVLDYFWMDFIEKTLFAKPDFSCSLLQLLLCFIYLLFFFLQSLKFFSCFNFILTCSFSFLFFQTLCHFSYVLYNKSYIIHSFYKILRQSVFRKDYRSLKDYNPIEFTLRPFCPFNAYFLQ